MRFTLKIDTDNEPFKDRGDGLENRYRWETAHILRDLADRLTREPAEAYILRDSESDRCGECRWSEVDDGDREAAAIRRIQDWSTRTLADIAKGGE